MNTPHPTRPRLTGLDFLRFLAVLLVVIRHIKPPPEDLPQPWIAILTFLSRGGWVGVDMFFVLSGFLVSGLLFNDFVARGRIGVGRFYLRRGFKIYPPFFVLIVFTVFFLQLRDGYVQLTALIVELLFLQSYLTGFWFHTWSLAVEEHFYLLLPLVLLAVSRLNRASATPLRPILVLAAIIIAASPAMRVANWMSNANSGKLFHQAITFPTHLRLDGLFLGTAISYAYHFHNAWFVRVFIGRRRLLICTGVACVLPAFAFTLEKTPWLFTTGYTLIAFGGGMILIATILRGRPANRLMRIGAFFGARSYSIYLWHLPVLILVNQFDIGGTYAARLVCYVSGAFAFGVAMSWLVESPMLWVRDKLFPARNQVAI